MNFDRRSFLSRAALSAGAAGLGALPSIASAESSPEPEKKRRGNRIGVSTYSFWHSSMESFFPRNCQNE